MPAARAFASTAAAVFALCATPSSAWGQIEFFTKIFDRASDANLFLQFGHVRGQDSILARGDNSRGLRGIGLEISFDLCGVTFGKKEEKTKRSPLCPVADDLEIKECTVTRRVRGREVTVTYTPKKPEPPDRDLVFELALGYQHTTGYRGQHGFRGSIDQLPSLALYLTADLGESASWSPYVGLHGRESGAVRVRRRAAARRGARTGRRWRREIAAARPAPRLPRI
jgi:hypothetical protein